MTAPTAASAADFIPCPVVRRDGSDAGWLLVAPGDLAAFGIAADSALVVAVELRREGDVRQWSLLPAPAAAEPDAARALARGWLRASHTRRLLAYFDQHGRFPSDGPVPGCVCVACLPRPRRPARRPPQRQQLDVEAARRLDILDVAQRLGLGQPRRIGAEWALLCPFHDDHSPSLRLNPLKQKAFCAPCRARGGRTRGDWDAVALTMDARRCTFAEAVRWLTNNR